MGWNGVTLAQAKGAATVECILEPGCHLDERVDLVPGKADIGIVTGLQNRVVTEMLLFKIGRRLIGRVIMKMNQQIIRSARISVMDHHEMRKAKRAGRTVQQFLQIGQARNILILRDQGSKIHILARHDHHHAEQELSNQLKYRV